MSDKIYTIEKGDGPLVATAIHDGHAVRDELRSKMFISESDRLREEDPFTGRWTIVANTRIRGLRSRFEVDLNRPREKAVYLKEEDAWGLKVWETQPSQAEIDESLSLYEDFYSGVHELFTSLKNRYGYFIVFDIHSYNHLRNGPDTPADPELNPEVNIGTGTMNRDFWSPIVDKFIDALGSFDYGGRPLDVRENVKFRGGNFPRWIHQNFPGSGCALAVEFKKFFMNEITGDPDEAQIDLIQKALKSTVPQVLEVAKAYGRSG